MFKLQFQEENITYWANRAPDLTHLQKIGKMARERKFLTKAEFLTLCKAKSPRSKSRCNHNTPELIKEITEISFNAKSEQVEIQSLIILTGVSWPTASFILHFCSERDYPILDYRALWSLSVDPPPVYVFDFWESYTIFCRTLAKRNKLSMRQLDSAIWQYSKENQ